MQKILNTSKLRRLSDKQLVNTPITLFSSIKFIKIKLPLLRYFLNKLSISAEYSEALVPKCYSICTINDD